MHLDPRQKNYVVAASRKLRVSLPEIDQNADSNLVVG